MQRRISRRNADGWMVNDLIKYCRMSAAYSMAIIKQAIDAKRKAGRRRRRQQNRKQTERIIKRFIMQIAFSAAFLLSTRSFSYWHQPCHLVQTLNSWLRSASIQVTILVDWIYLSSIDKVFRPVSASRHPCTHFPWKSLNNGMDYHHTAISFGRQCERCILCVCSFFYYVHTHTHISRFGWQIMEFSQRSNEKALFFHDFHSLPGNKIVECRKTARAPHNYPA